MSLINFTVEYDLLAASTDSTDEGADLDLVALIGEVSFTAQFSDDKAIQAPNYSPRPTGFKVLKFTGYMDTDGRLKSSRSGTVGVRLPANDPVLNLEKLIYKVDFNLTTPSGEKVRVASGFMEAPTTDITVNLTEALESTGYSSVSTPPTFYTLDDVASPLGELLVTADSQITARTVIGATSPGEVIQQLTDEDIPGQVAAAVAADETVVDAAAAAVTSAAVAGGLVASAKVPELDRNRVPNPQGKGGPVTNHSATLYDIAESTTGLPTGFSYALQVTRKGTNSSTVAVINGGATDKANANAIPVTDGEVISMSVQVWSDDPAAVKTARIVANFYNTSNVFVSALNPSGATLATSTWTQVTANNLTVPATATHVQFQVRIETTSTSSTGSVSKITAMMLSTGSTISNYGDGTSIGWQWTGTEHASPSTKLFRTPAEQTAVADASYKSLTTTYGPELARNRVLNPQCKGTPANWNSNLYTVSEITTGLPAGFSFGTQSVRKGTNSAIVAQVQPVSTTNAWAVSAGEVVSASCKVWSDDPVAGMQAAVVLYFYTSGNALVSSVSGRAYPLTASTWETRIVENVTVPATATKVLVQVLVNSATGTSTTGSATKVTGLILNSGATVAEYGDGSSTKGWIWTGTEHASQSVQLWAVPANLVTPTAPKTSPLKVIVSNSAKTLDVFTKFDTAGELWTRVTEDGSFNGSFNFDAVRLNGVAIHNISDSIAPVNTQFGWLAANHGYPNVRLFTNNGKTNADIGSVWTDTAGREYVLLGFSRETTPRLVIGGSYTGGGASPVSSATVNPLTNLTHVSGATNTTAIDYTTIATPGSDQYFKPSAGRVTVTAWMDGQEILSNGTYTGYELEIRESYEVLDYAAIYDYAKANPGAPLNGENIAGCILVTNSYRWDRQSRVIINASIEELRPVTVNLYGGTQAEILSASGYTITRYVPGMGTVGGLNWSAGVDMTSYATQVDLPVANVSVAGRIPAFHMDVASSGGTVLAGFVCGYQPFAPSGDGRSTQRATNAAPSLWLMANTKKAYPFIKSVSGHGWGRLEASVIRQYLTPAQVAKVLASKNDALTAYSVLTATT